MSDPIKAEIIQFPRSITEGAIPPAVSLKEGAMSVNLKDRTIYSLDDQGAVVVVGRDYDDVLSAHFGEVNPHGLTKADIDLGNVPNVDLRPQYLVNPPTMTLDQSALVTDIDYWEAGVDVIYTIDHDAYAEGDTINISRIAGDTGEITIKLDVSNSFLIRGTISTDDLIMKGGTPFLTSLRKISSTTWIVKVWRI